MSKKNFWKIQNNVSNSLIGELFLYGPIASSNNWDQDVNTPKQFKEDLDKLGDISELNIYINSGGGDVFAGQAIHSILKRHSAKKTVYIDGLAASIASVVAMAGDTIVMPKNAMMMIHKAWTICVGNANDFRKLADDLEKVEETIISAYESRDLTIARDEIVKLMDAETWLTADEALEYGFIDEVEEEKKVAASIDGGFLVMNGTKMDLSNYKNKPKFISLNEPNKCDQTKSVSEPKIDDEKVIENEIPLIYFEKTIEINEKKFKEEEK
ncbi:MAG: Clp protease ClpP [Ignavibacteriales bacterium]|nr:MAG: Clp protease ClpP [Ignavibacteriales bacterium]